MQSPAYVEGTIANGASLTGPLTTAHHAVVGVQVVGTWTEAGVVLEGSMDGQTYAPLKLPGGDLGWASSVVPTSGGAILILAQPLIGIPFVKVRSGAHASAVNQGGARTVRVLLQAA